MTRIKRPLCALLALCLLIGTVPAVSAAVPAGGNTTSEPFPLGTGGSTSFRIPALVTLSDGTLVAAADARWNTTYDGGGLDTIVATSSDGGANWTYSFANYLGDNGDAYNGSGSTAFIDPALAVTADDTVYMLVDLYPYGIALNGSGNTSPETTVGFFDDNKLKLRQGSSTSYDYYLDLTELKIYSYADNTQVTGYTVDPYFNITSTDGTVSSNLFFSDSPFKVVRTGYLYLTSSSDKGVTWSAPRLLNLKTDSELACLVGPGRGLVTKDDTIIFPVYSFHGDNNPAGNTQRMSFLYSSDGIHWSRTDELNYNWASESAPVELTDGTLRFFIRNGNSVMHYVDYDPTAGTWGTPVSTGIAVNSNCQMSAITYSGTIGGQQVILVSCPTGPNEAGSNQSGATYRLNGKIFAFTVGDGNALTKVGELSVTDNEAQFIYSCLTELKDGSVGILYEDLENGWGTGTGCYYTMEYATYDLTRDMGLTFDAPGIYDGAGNATGAVTIYMGTSGTELTFQGLADGQYLEVSGHDSGIAGVSVSGSTITVSPVAVGTTTATFTVRSLTLSATEGDTYTLAITVADLSKDDYKAPLTSQTTQGETQYVLDDDGMDPGEEYLIVAQYNGTYYALTDSGTTGGATQVTVTDNIASGTIADNMLWTFTESGTGYTAKSQTRYISMGSSNNTNLLSNSSRALTVTHAGSGNYRISYYYIRYTYYLAYTSWRSGRNTVTGFARTSSQSSVQLYQKRETVGGTQWTTNLTVLNEQIAAAGLYDQADYTEASWSALETALAAAQALTQTTHTDEAEALAAQDVIDTAAWKLAAAIAALEPLTEIQLNYQHNGITVKTETMLVDLAKTYTLPSNILGDDLSPYSVNNTTLTPKAGITAYNVPVTKLLGTPVTVKENELVEISVPLTEGQYVQWATHDATYVGVAGKYDSTAGAFTDTAVIAGQAVTDAPVVVTGTVYNADGTAANTLNWLVTVTEGDADTITDSRYIYAEVVTIENCTAYYSINGGPLTAINGTGILIDETVSGHFNIILTAAPHEGYALSYMAVTGSGNQYYTLADGNPDGTGSEAWPFVSNTQSTIPSSKDDSAWVSGHGLRWPLLEGNMTIEQLKLLLSNALDLGCTGLISFTKNSTASFYTQVQFAAQPLPTVEKSILSITHANGYDEPYTEGMTLEIGDTVHYQITITVPAEVQGDIYNKDVAYTSTSPITSSNTPSYSTGSFGSVQYTEVSLTDELTGSKFYTTVDETTQATLSLTSSSTSEAVHTFYTSITLQASNFLSVVHDGKLTNVADLSYHYSSNYTEGVLNTSAASVAEILVVVPEYVIDFALPLTINLNGDPLVAGDKITNAQIDNVDTVGGTVTITGDQELVYTPTKVLTGPVFITLSFEEDSSKAIIGYGVRIYPATTVYYEEHFASYTGTWATAAAPFSTPQQSSRPGISQSDGSASSVYGYDSAYANTNGPSGGTQAESDTFRNTAEFTFTGTGVEVYANCTPTTGLVNVLIRKGGATGSLIRFYQVDTKTLGSGAITEPQSGLANAYSLPILSLTGLDYGSYTVQITHAMRRKDEPKNFVYLDGFRVFGTLKNGDSIYGLDGEAAPRFLELRNAVLYLATVPTKPTNPASQYGQEIVDQVYASAGTGMGAVYLSREEGGWEDFDLQDLLDNGPKNELYLYKSGDSLVFTLDSSITAAQIGLKAIAGATSYTISVNGGTETTLTASTDMFYTLDLTAGQNNTVAITNCGDNILSVTKLKYFSGDPGSTTALADLTAENVELGLLASAAAPIPVTYGDVDGSGSVSGKDRTVLARYLAGWEGYAVNEEAADVNGDSKVTGQDRAILSRYLADWEGYDTLPHA